MSKNIKYYIHCLNKTPSHEVLFKNIIKYIIFLWRKMVFYITNENVVMLNHFEIILQLIQPINRNLSYQVLI